MYIDQSVNFRGKISGRGGLDVEQPEHSGVHATQEIEVVANLCLKQEPLREGEELTGERAGIVRLKQSLRRGVAHDGLEVFPVAIEDFRRLEADAFVLRAEFGAERDRGTATDLPALLQLGFLAGEAQLTESCDTLERRRLRRKNVVEQARFCCQSASIAATASSDFERKK